ncbi:MAG TPA: long-chain fatty acid--CoA ligase [Gemmatimonadales bacterium]|nr:long-chain fatty acid--CoA ligase [Gemmatimonadales bacterium]
MTTPRTLNEIFFLAVDRFTDRPAVMRSKRGGEWVALSYRDLLGRVQALSLGLRELGVKRGDRVAILAENSPDWATADYACLAAGCADVPIYPTLPAHQAAFILRDAGAVAVCVSSAGQLEKILAVRAELPALRHVIAFDPALARDGVLSLDGVIAAGRAAAARYPRWREEALEAAPDDLATLIYTSGTTGNPKGVMLTHGNITSNVVAALTLFEIGDRDECLSFLPLSHIFERMVGHYVMMWAGTIINYAQGIETVPADLQDRKPTVMASVPRLYEKIYAKVLEGVMAGPPLRQRIFFWAKRTAERWADLRIARRPIPAGLAVQKRIADKLVFSKLQQRTGGQVRFFVSGGAPLSADIARFFYAAGLPVYEGYGLTETSPVITVNTPDAIRLGSVGKPIPGVEVRIAGDGEILTRGPHVMKGYFNRPDATAEAIDAEGWLHTGDIGVVDGDGFLRITDRKKDIIVTAGGKNIAPQPIENRIKTNPFVLNAVVLGDKRKYPIMLVVPNYEKLRQWLAATGMPGGTDAELAGRHGVERKVEEEVTGLLKELAHFEMPKRFLLLTEDFSIENGMLTPSLKVKRRVVEEHYKDRIDALYALPGGD